MLFFVLDVLPAKYKSKVEKLYYEYRSDMLYTALAIVKDYSHAEDIVQLAFIRVIRHMDKISALPGSEVRGYIIYIVRNLSFDFLRKQKNSSTVPPTRSVLICSFTLSPGAYSFLSGINSRWLKRNCEPK